MARYLNEHLQVECTFVYNSLPDRFNGGIPEGSDKGLRLMRYQSRGASRDTHFCNLHTEISMWHCDAVYKMLRARPDIRPDIVVGHSGFGTGLFLPDLYQCPYVVHCEYFECPRNPRLYSRPEFPPSEADILRARTQNATNLLNLEACTAAYSPTSWQRSLFPAEYQHKISTIFDGIDRDFWYGRKVPRRIRNHTVPEDTRIVTYCAYGLEAARGFDIFMKVAQRICDARKDVLFVIVGAERPYYGEDLRFIREKSFVQHVLSGDVYDLNRFVFTGQILENELVEILSLSDLHIYLSVPFVLSWSMMDALACGCTVLGSATPPVEEMIRHEQNGLLAGLDDVEELTSQALRVLQDPSQFRHLGEAGTRLIDEKYSLSRTAPELLALLQSALDA
jgi:glycosyltransferase involved in cell wall biosynthesis